MDAKSNFQGTLARTQNPAPADLKYAGLIIRCVAGVLDFIVVLIPFSVFVTFLAVGMNVWNSFFFEFHSGQPLPPDLAQKGPTFVYTSLLVFLVLGWLYFALLESSPWRATVGKHHLGLYIGDENGKAISFWR